MIENVFFIDFLIYFDTIETPQEVFSHREVRSETKKSHI